MIKDDWSELLFLDYHDVILNKWNLSFFFNYIFRTD